MASVRLLTASFVILCFIVTMIPRSESLSCTPCNKAKCQTPKGCKYGLTKDICFCCFRCAKGRGEECGGDWGEVGGCAAGLDCLISRNKRSGKCVTARS